MAIIKCSECGAMISDKATQCPKCGYNFAAGPSDDVLEETISKDLGQIVSLVTKARLADPQDNTFLDLSFYNLNSEEYWISVFFSDENISVDVSDVIEEKLGFDNDMSSREFGLYDDNAVAEHLLALITLCDQSVEDVEFMVNLENSYRIQDGQLICVDGVEDELDDSTDLYQYHNQYQTQSQYQSQYQYQNQYQYQDDVEEDSGDAGKVFGIVLSIILAIFYLIL